MDETTIKMMVSDYSMTYGCEYVGCDVNQIITPIRDRFTLLFVHTIQQFIGEVLGYLIISEQLICKLEMKPSCSRQISIHLKENLVKIRMSDDITKLKHPRNPHTIFVVTHSRPSFQVYLLSRNLPSLNTKWLKV